MSLILNEQTLLTKKAGVFKSRGVLAHKNGVVDVITNTSGQDIVYEVTKSRKNPDTGEKETYKEKRVLPMGMSANISTTGELNALVNKGESTFGDSNDPKTYRQGLGSSATLAKETGLSVISTNTVEAIERLKQLNPNLTDDGFRVGSAVAVTQGYFLKLSETDFPEKPSIQKDWGTPSGRHIFMKTNSEGKPLEVYFNDDGQEPFKTIPRRQSWLEAGLSTIFGNNRPEPKSVADLAKSGKIATVSAKELGIDLRPDNAPKPTGV